MSAPVAVGDVVARKYRIDRVLGQGGMGIVVAATDTQLDRRVAIKFLLPDALKNADIVARFGREARAAAKIHSEHVARIIDVGELETGAPFMVMEYLEGGDLADRIRAQPAVPVADAARYLLQACEALAEAHAAGIVHRDLKPANLFLAKRPDHTVSVKVLDFGISKAPVASGGITSTQAVMGSPHYMSPEQLVSSKHVDPRSDVWSLGVVLYEMLAGLPPFQGDTMPEIVAQILQSPTPGVRATRPDVPAELEAVIARCTAKDPGARFADVAELARALVPFAPDCAQSAERAARVLGVAPPASNAASSRAASGDAMAPASPSPTAPAGTPAEVRADTAWGNTRAAGVPRRGAAPYVVGAVLGVAALIGAVVMFGGHVAPPPAPPVPAFVSAVPATPPVPSIPLVPVVLAPTASVALDPVAPSSASTAAPSKPAPGRPSGPPRPAPASPAPVASTTPVPAAPPAPPPAPTDPLHMGIK
jgi:serine/threonine-protein kinase